MEVLNAARVPAGPILSTADICAEPQYLSRSMIQKAEPPAGARVGAAAAGRAVASAGESCSGLLPCAGAGPDVLPCAGAGPDALPCLRAPFRELQAARRSRCPHCCPCCTARPAARAGRGRSWESTPTRSCEGSWAWLTARSRGCGRWAPSEGPVSFTIFHFHFSSLTVFSLLRPFWYDALQISAQNNKQCRKREQRHSWACIS